VRSEIGREFLYGPPVHPRTAVVAPDLPEGGLQVLAGHPLFQELFVYAWAFGSTFSASSFVPRV
jgi:hypothetical protein